VCQFSLKFAESSLDPFEVGNDRAMLSDGGDQIDLSLQLTPIGGSAPIGDSARNNNYSTVFFKSVVSQTSAENSETGTRSKDGQF
jgi:hypothetical protein